MLHPRVFPIHFLCRSCCLHVFSTCCCSRSFHVRSLCRKRQERYKMPLGEKRRHWHGLEAKKRARFICFSDFTPPGPIRFPSPESCPHSGSCSIVRSSRPETSPAFCNHHASFSMPNKSYGHRLTIWGAAPAKDTRRDRRRANQDSGGEECSSCGRGA